MGKVLCFGEVLLRFAPDASGNWLAQTSIPVYAGGAELNVASALAKWNIPTRYFTAVPENFLGNQVLAYLKERNIDVTGIYRGGARIGTYYLEEGADVKHAGIVYDRALSAFAELQPGMLNWDEILDGVDWLHLSAICPALSNDTAALCVEAVKMAKSRNIEVSIDLNYRAKLWQYGKQPIDIMPLLLPFCDLVMGNIWAAEKMLGISVDEALIHDRKQEDLITQANRTAATIFERYPLVVTVANTWRFSENGITYFTSLHNRESHFVSKTYETHEVIDKVGSGDCFMAGLIFGRRKKLSDPETLSFASAAAFQKLFIKGDATTQSAEDIFNLIHQDEQ